MTSRKTLAQELLNSVFISNTNVITQNSKAELLNLVFKLIFAMNQKNCLIDEKISEYKFTSAICNITGLTTAIINALY